MSQPLDIEKFLSSFPDYKPEKPMGSVYSPKERKALFKAIDALVPKNMTSAQRKAFVADIIEKQHALAPA